MREMRRVSWPTTGNEQTQRRIFWPTLAGIAVFAAGLLTIAQIQSGNAITARVVAPVSQSSGVVPSPRRRYPYSVIPGGAYNRAELRNAATNDPLVRDHYRDFALTRTRLVILRQNRRQYVSYRIAGQIFWTKKRLLIPKGEMLLTDGIHYARTRCGNRLSDKPQNEISFFEPTEAVLESDPSRVEVTQAASQIRQTSKPHTGPREIKTVVPVGNAGALMSSANGPALPEGLVVSPFPRDYITSPVVTPAIPLANGKSLITPLEVALSPPAEPAVVPEPSTLYLFGFAGISSLAALLWLGRPRPRS